MGVIFEILYPNLVNVTQNLANTFLSGHFIVVANLSPTFHGQVIPTHVFA